MQPSSHLRGIYFAKAGESLQVSFISNRQISPEILHVIFKFVLNDLHVLTFVYEAAPPCIIRPRGSVFINCILFLFLSQS